MKTISDIISKQDIESWKPGEIIAITAGTGKGKSHFIKNSLYFFAKEKGKKILFLVNRCDSNNQFSKELMREHKDDIITMLTYQNIEYNALNNTRVDLNIYDYIVCDEAHYFLSDEDFNKNTDISFNGILNTPAIKIFMSATSNKIYKYIRDIRDISLMEYKLPITFDFIDNLYFYKENEIIEDVIKNILSTDEKIIFFTNNIEYALELKDKFKDNVLFNCSKTNKQYKHVDQEKINDMLENEMFNKKILVTTSCMDTAVNIKDTKVKNIICDIQDVDCLIQCLGRKRILNSSEKINVYIKIKNNMQLGGRKTILNNKIKMAKFLKDHTTKELIAQFPRQVDTNNIIYDVPINEYSCIKKINELAFYKCIIDIDEINDMLSLSINSIYKYGYCKYIENKLGIKATHLDNTKEYNNTLEEYLKSLVNKKLFAEDREALKSMFKNNGLKARTMGINTLNGNLKDRKIKYKIINSSSPTTRIVNGNKKSYRYWQVVEI